MAKHLELIEWVLQEVVRIQRYMEPRRIQCFHNAQHTFRRAPQPPMVFQTQEHAAIHGFAKRSLNKRNHLAKGIFIRVPFNDCLYAAVDHRRTGRIGGVPAN